MIGNIRNQENCDFEEMGKIVYLPKSVNGSKINQIGLLGIKIVEGFVILLIVCDNEQYLIELGEYEDNKVKYNGRFFFNGTYNFLVIPSTVLSLVNFKNSREMSVFTK